MIETPFQIGDTMWAVEHSPKQIKVPCPVCAGKRQVELILGDGEHVWTDCDGCGLGYERARGFVEEYVWTPGARRFVIAGVASMHGGDDWYLTSEGGSQENLKNLFATEAEALAQAEKNRAAQIERNMMAGQRKRKDAGNRATRDAYYHRREIKECERKIAWHSARVTKEPKQEA